MIEITVKVGSTTYQGSANISTMNDDFLFGLHFMKATSCDMIISECFVSIEGSVERKFQQHLKGLLIKTFKSVC